MNRPEQSLQISCVQLLRTALPDVVAWHTPNSGARTRAEAGIFKAMGVTPGVPDLAVILPQGGIGFCELKAGKEKLRAEQVSFRGAAVGWGAQWAEIRTIEDFERTLREWFPRERFRTTVLGGGK